MVLVIYLQVLDLIFPFGNFYSSADTAEVRTDALEPQWSEIRPKLCISKNGQDLFSIVKNIYIYHCVETKT